MEGQTETAPLRLGPGCWIGRLLLFELWVLVFTLQMAVFWGDRIAWKLLRHERRTRFLLRGRCERSGLCCQTLGIELPASWVRRPRVLRFFQRWYARVHNFQTLGPPQGRLMPMACGYLRGGNTCSIYPFRPKLCREYPQLGLFGKIELHRGCGFWFVERVKQGTFEESLLEREHEAERRIFLRGGDGPL